MVKPNLNDIKALIEQAEKLKREVEQLKKKSFLTQVQSEAIKAGTDIALYLLRLSYTNREECENNFGIVDSYFTLTGSLNSGRFAQNLGDRYTDDCGEKPERIEWYNPNKHTGLFARYNFDEKKFRQFLNQYTAKQRQLYWKNYIQPLIIQLDTDLTPWLPFMKPYIDTEKIQEAIKTAEPATLSDAIYKIKKIQKVVETEVRQEPAETEQEIKFQETDDGRWMVQQAEGQTLEFKETLMYSIYTEQKDEDVLKESLKTIVGFLNAKGGTLLIGVSDDGNIKGLKEDFMFVHKKNQDGFQLRLRDFIRNQFDPEPVGQINITFKEFNGKVICQVEVKACKEITHLDKETYVRDGNQTLKLEGRRLTDWIRIRQRLPH